MNTSYLAPAASGPVRAAILTSIPQQQPFRFVDAITYLDDTRAEGNYLLDSDAFYFKGHFPGYPVVPGVILTEIMAQIGLIPLGIYLLQGPDSGLVPLNALPVLTASAMQFYKQVTGGQRVYVTSEKILFRHGKLRCKVRMHDQHHTLLCEGELAGMVTNIPHN
ncbi:3-hydroxyacyl-ACP dehydratase FabZ family protein [Fibrella aquatilis]|uniref:Hydroxymyristoyl-ACP dehydratase n=1 Tax=Fibrella aquatilis TaxID=2817059 RepID=A0A939K1E9_9BACT|nr:hydroxymyristoyl-ACP dehydratase [Fibrella aquatilis]MBO0932981.1 hydroxymyristoyl-ACP dehydratase [Fibrella aquatilis]